MRECGRTPLPRSLRHRLVFLGDMSGHELSGSASEGDASNNDTDIYKLSKRSIAVPTTHTTTVPVHTNDDTIDR